MRWCPKNCPKSFPETFYVVESCGEYDAMLREDIMKLKEGYQLTQAHTFLLPRETVADRERRLAMVKAREEEAVLAESAREKRVREECERMRAELKRERENKIARETPEERERRVTRENAMAELRKLGTSTNEYFERKARLDYNWAREDMARERQEREEK